MYNLFVHLNTKYQSEFIPNATVPVIKIQVEYQQSRKYKTKAYVNIDLTFDVSDQI